MHSALPARLLVDDTHAYILTDCEGGNHVSARGVGGNVPLVTVDLGRQPKLVKCTSPHLEVAIQPCDVRQLSLNFFTGLCKRGILWKKHCHEIGP